MNGNPAAILKSVSLSQFHSENVRPTLFFFIEKECHQKQVSVHAQSKKMFFVCVLYKIYISILGMWVCFYELFGTCFEFNILDLE